jgi:hypothetical protein
MQIGAAGTTPRAAQAQPQVYGRIALAETLYQVGRMDQAPVLAASANRDQSHFGPHAGLRWNQPIPAARLKTAVDVLQAVRASKSSHPSPLRTWPSPSERPFFFSRQVYPRNMA